MTLKLPIDYILVYYIYDMITTIIEKLEKDISNYEYKLFFDIYKFILIFFCRTFFNNRLIQVVSYLTHFSFTKFSVSSTNPKQYFKHFYIINSSKSNE